MPAPFDKSLAVIKAKPGIQRDGTKLDSGQYVDGQWCRFRLGKPKKIGGYQEIANGLNGPIRGLHVHPSTPQHVATLFSDKGVQCQLVDSSGRGGGSYDRTPADFATGGSYTWTYDTLFDSTGSGVVKMIAHAARTDWADIDDTTELPVYIGDATGANALTDVTGVVTSGGIVILQPFLFVYGNNGLIMNSAANAPLDYVNGAANAANVSGTKIVKGLPLRGGASAPAGLFWALDSLIRVSWAGSNTWRYDTVDESTILTPNGVIQMDGIYYWPGIDRFLSYNGIIQELPNPTNQDFFFDNLNWAFRNKVWVTSVKRWGEIWWHFPMGDATECNHAIIYNVREKVWYDTPISRSSGAPARVLHFPVWADSNPNNDDGSGLYRIYMHETGLDAVFGGNQAAIKSYFETPSIALATDPELAETPNVQTRIAKVEPDFQMSGQMTVEVLGSANAQTPEEVQISDSFEPTTPIIDIVTQLRVMRLRFTSNQSGGDFHMGRTMLHVEPGDQQQ